MARVIRRGRITMLRAHERGTGYGPESDFIDVEAVVKLDSNPQEAYGFQLRPGEREPAHRAMFNLLRDAFTAGRTVQLEVDIDDGRRNGLVVRITVQPAPARRLPDVSALPGLGTATGFDRIGTVVIPPGN